MVISHSTVGGHPKLEAHGPRLRESQGGPEDDLVRSFVTKIPANLRELCITKFQEPRLGPWFPDLVLVYWNPDVADTWPSARRALQRTDFRVLQCLRGLGQAGTSTLGEFIGSDVRSSLQRLERADLVFQASHTWRARSLKDSFAVRRLVAIEAKIKNWQRGLEQASRNRWFASESYLLLRELPATSDVRAQAEAHGVGVVTVEDHLSHPRACPSSRDLPCSYASWLFNDWAWLWA